MSEGSLSWSPDSTGAHTLTHTAGGDTLMDGDVAKPVMDGDKLTGNIYEDDATEERYTAPQQLTSSISGTLRLKGHKVYLANSSITVNSGATLTLLPGAIIKFASGCSMTVNGTIDAQGTLAAPIVFTSQKDDTWGGDTNGDGEKTYAQAGDWEEITIASGGCAKLMRVVARYGGYGLYSNQGDAIIRNYGVAELDGCIVEGSNLRLLYSSGVMTVQNCVLRDGRWGSDGNVRPVNCVVTDCSTGTSGGSAINTIYYDCPQALSGSQTSNCIGCNCGGGTGNLTVADPKFVDPDNGDFRIAADSPCIDAGDGTVAPEFDYYGRPRMDAKGKKATGVPNADGICPDIGIYEFSGKAIVPAADLAVVSVTAPSAAVPGEELAITYVVTNRGAAATFTARVKCPAANCRVTKRIRMRAAPSSSTASFRGRMRSLSTQRTVM